MCLSSVYLNERKEANLLMDNVMHIHKEGDVMVLTDLMERTKRIRADLLDADLGDSWVVLKERSSMDGGNDA